MKPLPELNIDNWVSEYSIDQVRAAIGSAAKGKRANDGNKDESKAWFKREDRGERLGELIRSYQTSLGSTELVEGMTKIKSFAYHDTKLTKSGVSTVAGDDSNR